MGNERPAETTGRTDGFIGNMSAARTKIELGDFAQEIDAASGLNLDISSCFGCARCSSVCKVAIFGCLEDRITPRTLLYNAVVGETEKLLSSKFIWLCSGCGRCEEACPQGVKIPMIVSAIRRLSMEKGILNPITARVNERVCMHCGACLTVCKNKAITMVEGGSRGLVARVDPAECRGCGACTAVCTNAAIQQSPLNDLGLVEFLAGKSGRD